MIVPTANYPTSRDYRQLWELAHTAAIVCIVDMDHGKPDTCRDIARTVYSPEWSPELVQVGSRGIGHVWAESLETFIAGCEQCNLEWLVPPTALAQPEGEGLSLAEVDELCAEFGFHLDDDRGEGLEILQEMIGAALSRWGRPITPPAPEVGEDFWYPNFADWLEREMPKGTVIGDPLWWASKIAHRIIRFPALVQQFPEPAPAVVPVAVSERPWEREGWCDEHGRCWLHCEFNNGLRTPSWRLARPCDYDFTVKGVVWLALPHDALPVSPSQAGEVQS